MIGVPETGVELLGGLVAAIIAGALWLRKLKPSLAVDDKLAAIANADTGIIERLERESNRLAEQNDKLSTSLNDFQMQLLSFQTENNKLSRENAALREENFSLREEIMELRKEVHDLGREMMLIRDAAKLCDGCDRIDIAHKLG